jgi:hypothetical protein
MGNYWLLKKNSIPCGKYLDMSISMKLSTEQNGRNKITYTEEIIPQ